jgi:hypothetical protein
MMSKDSQISGGNRNAAQGRSSTWLLRVILRLVLRDVCPTRKPGLCIIFRQKPPCNTVCETVSCKGIAVLFGQGRAQQRWF